MLLDAVPQKNRSLIISLHMMAVTLSNALMPYLGVWLYEALGADLRALALFNVVVLCLRLAAFALFAVRALRESRAPNALNHAAPAETAPRIRRRRTAARQGSNRSRCAVRKDNRPDFPESGRSER